MVTPLLVLALAAQTADWPQWRGPNRDGLAASFRSPEKWPAALALKWKTAMGPSYASPVASASRIFAFVRENEQETVLAVDRASGRIVWRQSYPAPFEKNPYALRMGKGPYSTPLLEQGRLHTLGSGGILSSWNAASGALVWRNDYSSRVKTAKLFTGTAMSPLIAGGLLIVHIGDDSGGSVLALDPQTGREKWKWDGDGPG
ncbi:MAG: PQQ-binding-like beta-propeller repeat protein, partial [Bryobacteraceae bacterium]